MREAGRIDWYGPSPHPERDVSRPLRLPSGLDSALAARARAVACGPIDWPRSRHPGRKRTHRAAGEVQLADKRRCRRQVVPTLARGTRTPAVPHRVPRAIGPATGVTRSDERDTGPCMGPCPVETRTTR